MLRTRVGWKTVTAIVVFLLVRAVTATVLEVMVGGNQVMPYRVGATVFWIALLVALALGKEPARFFVVMVLSLGSALAVTVLLDPKMIWYDETLPRIAWIRYYLMFFIASNLAMVPLLAFSKPVRSFFSRVPAYAGPIQ